ncbi:MAG: transcriptional regulator [Polynucleobacter sp.]|nr:transcriptional regulator [Polynucleobacter sp.]
MAKTKFSERNTLPYDGCSRWGQIKQYLPVSREKFRQLSIEGKAPKPLRMGVRCTFYSNKELHKFLENPLNYKWEDLCPTE